MTKASQTEIATLAGGCFWGMEELLRALPGVLETTVGYTGGEKSGPTYEDVKKGDTGHAESVQIVFDPQKPVMKRSYSSSLKCMIRQLRTGKEMISVLSTVPQSFIILPNKDRKQKR